MLGVLTDRLTAPSTSGEPPRLDCDVDTIGNIIGNTRRQLVIQYLDEYGATTLRDLAEYIARHENEDEDEGAREYTYNDRKNAYISLYQHHLDQLDDARVIEWDKNRKTIAPSVNHAGFAAVLHALTTVQGGESR